jgi:hypothetical protein
VSSAAVAGFTQGDLVAQGGFARVFEARGPRGEEAVIKVARERGGSPGTTRARFACPAVAVVLGSVTTSLRTVGSAEVDEVLRGEAALLDRAGGDLLPRLLGQGVVAGRPALVLERLRGPSLRQLFLEKKTVEPAAFVQLLEALARGAEGRLAFHGDLKPDHVFLEGGPRLIDPAFRTETPRFYTVTPEYNPLLAVGPVADVVAVVAMLAESFTGALLFANAPPAFTLRLIPNAAEERREREHFRNRVGRLAGRPEVPANVARFVDSALDVLLLQPGGGSLSTPRKAAEELRRQLG